MSLISELKLVEIDIAQLTETIFAFRITPPLRISQYQKALIEPGIEEEAKYYFGLKL